MPSRKPQVPKTQPSLPNLPQMAERQARPAVPQKRHCVLSEDRLRPRRDHPLERQSGCVN